MAVSPAPSFGALSKRLAGSAIRPLRETQFAELVKFCYLWPGQSFSYKGVPAMAGRLLRELTIRQLRALAAVQKHRSVTAAAKQLHLTQPAVTLQLRNLQALAGLPLIQRTGDGMLLTDAGREVLALADRIEAAIADCETTLEMMAGKTAGAYRSAPSAPRNISCRSRSPDFRGSTPNIDVTLFDRQPAGDRHRAARLRSRFRDHGPSAGGYRHERSPDRRSSPCHHRADRASPGAKIPHRA